MVTLCTCGSHDCCIGDRGAVVTTNRTSQSSCYCDDEQFACRVHDRHYDRQQDTECTPGCTCCKCQEYSDAEYDHRDQVCQYACAVFQDTGYKYVSTQQTCNAGQCPCECQDHDRGNHCFEAFRQAVHELTECQNLTRDIQEECDDQRCSGAQQQTNGSIAVCKCIDECFAIEETACVDHTNDTGDDQNNYGQDQVDYFTVTNGSLCCISTSVGSCICCVQVAVQLCVSFMFQHGAEVCVCQCQANHCQDCQESIEVVRDRSDEQV